MNTFLKISVNSASLATTLEFSSPEAKPLNELRLMLTAELEVQFSESRIILPWHTFKIYVAHIGRVLKENDVSLSFDDLGLKLIEEYLDDRKKIRDIKPISTTKDEIQRIFRENGFVRWKDLKDEQYRDILALLGMKHGANFSVPGAGKTSTLLGVHTFLKHSKRVSKLFVVCPINAFISWEEEIKAVFSAPLKVVRLTTSRLNNFNEVIQMNPDVVLVNYEKLRKESTALVSFFWEHGVHLILDESHRIKSGANNLSYALISKLADISRRRDVLSGTPMPQSYLDLKPQFEILWPSEQILPELLPNDYSNKIDIINSALKGKYVRTTKNELGLRDPIIRYTKIKLGPIQSDLYRLFKSETARLLAGMDRSSIGQFRQIGRSVVRLIQASTNPMLLGTSDEFPDDIMPIPAESHAWQLLEEFVKYETPRKLDYLRERVKAVLQQDGKSKIVIWSTFIRNIQLLERIFKDFNPVSIYGNVPTSSDEGENNREGRIRKFHVDDSCRLMIANPQACGEGISLHQVCHYAIYLDRNFNAAHFLQSIDRIHRLGLPKDIETNVEVLIAEETIDEVLVQRLSEKISAMGEILDDKYLKALAYDPADLPPDDDGIDKEDLLELKRHVQS